MTTFFETLVRMSLQGIVIILLILFVRILWKKFAISHKYVVGLWLIVFFLLAFPWKISLPIGFWNDSLFGMETNIHREAGSEVQKDDVAANEPVQEQGGVSNETSNNKQESENIIGQTGNGMQQSETITGQYGQLSEKRADYIAAFSRGIFPYIWLVVFMILLVRFLSSYFNMKKKLLVSIPYKENIWWAEEIQTPMVFGLFPARIYIPISMEEENLEFILAHENMHIRRKDDKIKIIAYMICLFHWFNPFVWLAYILLGNDMEKACDEAVIGQLGTDKKKEYAYALIQFSSADDGKKKLFAAPIGFDEGGVKARIQNILNYKYTLPGVGFLAVVLGIGLLALFLTRTEETSQDMEQENQMNEQFSEIPVFYTGDTTVLQLKEPFSIKDYYITNCHTASNHFFIDEQGTLWGSGSNEYGQLGTGSYGVGERQEEPIKIAEHVVSVDASWNDYFCIYLTENGELYGMGLNFEGLIFESEEEIIPIPTLLMEDVAYAKAARESIAVLQTDKTAWWWGQYKPILVRMYADKPMKIMENCKYITTGVYTGAAISEDDELYTWGYNAFGECGVEVILDDVFVKTPVKVLDDVKMVWVDRISFGNFIDDSLEFWDGYYPHNVFVLREDGSIQAVGKGFGDKEQISENEEGTDEMIPYSDVFVPIQIKQF